MTRLANMQKQLDEQARKAQERMAAHVAALEYPVRQSNQYTTEQKCAAFDALHAWAAQHWEDTKQHGEWSDCDHHYYAFAELMQLLIPEGATSKELWTQYGAL